MRKISKRILALSLASVMTFSLAACGKDGNTPASNTTQAGTSSTTGGSSDDGATYTYNLALADFPTNWSTHNNQTNTDSEYMMQFITAGFYKFDYNENKDGYKLVPHVAVSEPEDVTAEYAEQYGIEADASARIWKLTLRDDLKWDDGTPITAQDFVRSAELLLNPKAQNHRADQLYSGSLAVVNAKNYLYAGQHAYVAPVIVNGDEYFSMDDVVADDNGVFTVDGRDVAFSINDGGAWSSNSLADYYAAGEDYQAMFMKDGVDVFTELFQANADANGFVKVTQEVHDALVHVIAGLQGAASVDEYIANAGDYAEQEWQEFCYYGETYPEMDFSEVGIFAPSDTELVLVLENPLSGFYLLYALTDGWLVKEDLYLSCETENGGVYSNSYGTSAETTASFGPYKLVSFQADKQYVLERNEHFFGLVDGQYQTTTIQVDCVAEPSTRLEMLLNGQLDSYGLGAEDMETYAASDYTYYTTTESTFFMALNPDMAALEAAQKALGANYNKTILTVKQFRQALAYAMDRSAFALATSPTNNAAFGVFSDLIISNPEEGEGYRSTEEAKWVLADFWGLSDDIGSGKMYETVDDAVASITGYNLEMAKQMFNEAYDIAIEQGLMDEDDVIQIMVGTPNSSSNFYNKGYEFIANCYTEAVVGTSLEGKLTFAKNDTLGNGFGEALRSNQVDMLFGVGWSGAALDPYSLVEAYTTDQYQYNPHWDTAAEKLTVELGGVEYTASVLEWTETLGGVEITITAADGTTKAFKAGSSDGVDEERFQILVALEGAILETYDLIPLIDNSTAALKGMQIEYYTEDYVFGVGRAGGDGVQYLSYNYSDQEWTEFVSSQGNTLNYN